MLSHLALVEGALCAPPDLHKIRRSRRDQLPAFDFRHALLVEQRGLQRALIGQGADPGGPQGEDPVASVRLEILADAELAGPDGRGGGVGRIPGKRLDGDRPPTSGSVGRMWSIQTPNPKPQNGAQRDCPQAFHALRTAENAKQPDDRKNRTLENNPVKSYKPPKDAANRTPKRRINAERVQTLDRPPEIGQEKTGAQRCDHTLWPWLCTFVLSDDTDIVFDEDRFLELNMETEIEFGENQSDEVQPETHLMGADEILAKNSFRIFYQTNNFLLPQIWEMIEKREAINLRPEYQRRLRWAISQKSRLIESLMLNIPVPPVFFYEAKAARYEVMDGQQRLSAIADFFSGTYALGGLKVLKDLNGFRYQECSPRVRRTLDRATISVVVLLKESEAERLQENRNGIADIRRLVFDRLNTGGRRLNAQEIRNALNPGPLNDCIIKCSRFKLFTDVFGIPHYTEQNEEEYYENPDRQKNSLYAKMYDCELILRFVALRKPENIRGSMKSMLDRAMEEKLNDTEADQLEKDFCSRFSFLYKIFESNLFKIPAVGDRKEILSAALYDASMVAIDRVWNQKDKVISDREGVNVRLRSAIENDDEYELIVGRKNTAESVRNRIDLLQNILLPE